MNLKTTQTITLDLTIPKIKNIRCVENDSQSRIIHILVTNNGEAYPLDSAIKVKCKIHKPDHTYIFDEQPVLINPDGTVTIILIDQAMAVPGVARCELLLSDLDDNIISSMPFNIITEKSILGNKEIESKNESDVINGMIKHLVDYDNPHKMPDATTEIKGITKLTDSINSSSTDTAATPNSVKQTYDALTGETARAKSAEQTISDTISRNKPDWDDAADKKHVHANKSVLDGISSALVSDWNDAAARSNNIIIGSITNGSVSTSLSKYGITASMTVEQIWKLLPSESIAFINSNAQSNIFSNSLPVAKGCLILYGDIGRGRGWAKFHKYDDTLVYFARFHDEKISEWTTNYLPLTGGTLTGILTVPNIVTTDICNINGNAATSTRLSTARSIFGKTFDGTGDIAGQGLFYGTYNSNIGGRFSTSGLQIRENGLVASTQADIGYAPSIGFHWGNRIAGTLLFHNDGKYYFLAQNGYSKSTVVANLEGDATNADTVDGIHAKELLQLYNSSLTTINNTNLTTGFHNIENTDIGIGNGTYYSILNLGLYSGGNYRSQIAFPYQDNISDSEAYIRTAKGTNWRAWRRLIHSGNVASKGSSTRPIYFDSNGVAQPCSYTLGSSVPSGAKFTDTTYSIMRGATSNASGTSGLVPVPSSNAKSKFLRGDGTWADAGLAHATVTYGSPSYLYTKYSFGEADRVIIAQTNNCISSFDFEADNWIRLASRADNSCIEFSSNALYPSSYNSNNKPSISLGTSYQKWNVIYASSGTINTSDRNEKKDEKELDDDFVIKLVMGLSPKSYKFKENTSNRTHYGFIAQDIENLLPELGITSKDIAAFIKSPNKRRTEQEVKIDGTLKKITKEDVITEGEDGYGFTYGLRYEELISPLYKFCQILYRQNQEQKKQLEELKNR